MPSYKAPRKENAGIMSTHDSENASTPVISVENPRTGKTLYSMPEPSPEDVERMFDKARGAAERLRAMTPYERGVEAEKLKQYILNNHKKIATRIVEETGKCMTDALMMEVFPVVDTITYYQKNAGKFLADERVKTPLLLAGKKSRIYYEPMGVVLIIAPWNYPFHLSVIPSLCAYFAGNAVLLKPSRYTPLRGVLEDIVKNSGFMGNALQVVYASRRTAGLLIEKRPDKIHFTGSVGVGRQIMEQASKQLIPVELELGGKDPMIVFEDANLGRAVNGALWGSMANCGQTCTSIERIFVQDRIHDQFVQLMKEKVEKLRQTREDTPSDDGGDLDVGCMTAEFQIREIEAQLAEARTRGAKILTGGARSGNSHVFPPTIITEVERDMKIQWDESFGPVVTIRKFGSEDDAVAMANDSPFGLASSVWSADLARAERVARRLVTGNVSINNVLATQANSALPFGGLRDSGFGRYRGKIGLHAFSNSKSVLIDRMSGRLEPYWYPYSGTKLELLIRMLTTLYTGGPLAFLRILGPFLKLERLNRRNRL